MRPAGWQLRLGLLLAAVLAVAAGLLAQATGALQSVEQRSIAARFDLRGAETPKDVVLVAIDEKTFEDTGLQWPFPRSEHGKAIDALSRAGVREIVYDVQFTEETEQREDLALYSAVERAGGAVLATSEVGEGGSTNVLGGDENLAAIGARAGAANLPPGFGGVLNRFPFENSGLRSLALVAAERAGGPKLTRAGFGGDGAWIDFRGPPGTIETVSFSDLVAGKVDPAVLKGRVAVVGASAPSLQDVHATPTSAEPMAGGEIQANAIWTALHGLPLADASTALDIALVVLLALVVPLLRLRLRVLAAAVAAPVVVLAYLGAAQVAFERGVVLWVAAPVLALAVGTLAMVVASHLAESMARERVTHDNDLLELEVRARTLDLRETQLEILQRLSRAAEWRDEDTGLHIARMGKLSQRLGQALGLSRDEYERLGHAAVAHDIGKLAVPDAVLLKPGRLDLAERTEMQRHALVGASMLSDSRSPVMQTAEVIARTHHEKWDGSGYPHGLAGTDIPLVGRICGICDVFDALVSSRPYKRAWGLDEALDEIRAQSGRHFDPGLVEEFCALAPAAYAELYDRADRAPRDDDDPARRADPRAQPVSEAAASSSSETSHSLSAASGSSA